MRISNPTIASSMRGSHSLAHSSQPEAQRDAGDAAAPTIGTSRTGKKGGGPLVVHVPTDVDPEVQKVFARANRGNREALARVRGWVRDRRWAEWLGNLGADATRQLLALVSEGSPVWTVGLEEKADQLLAELEGEKPSVLEKLLARRVLNNWIAVHTLELERAVKNPKGDELESLDRAIGRADRRFQQSVRELAQVRRLQAPRVLLDSIRGDAIIPLIPGPPGAEG
jgi:hypothetical protein